MTPKELKELREKAQTLLNQMRSLHTSATSDKRAMNAQETENYENMQREFDDLRAQIGRAEKLIEAEHFMGENIRDAVRDIVGNVQNDNDVETYSREFMSFIRGAEFNPSILRNMNLGTQADGGYVVPRLLQSTVIRSLLDAVFVRQLANVIQTSSTTDIPLGTTKPTFGLITENGAYPETDTKFSLKTLNAYKVGGIIKASEEILNDSAINLEQYITTLMVEGIAAFEENKFINGTGTSDYTGLTKGTVGKTTAATNAVTSDEIIDMYYSVANKYRPTSSWIISDDFEKAVMKLKDSTGRYIWQLGLTAGAPNMLLNRPVYNSAFMPSLGTGNAIAVFGDMKYYQIADRGAMTMKRLNELYAGTGQIGFQVMKRGDSKIILDEAIKVMKNA